MIPTSIIILYSICLAVNRQKRSGFVSQFHKTVIAIKKNIDERVVVANMFGYFFGRFQEFDIIRDNKLNSIRIVYYNLIGALVLDENEDIVDGQFFHID